MEIQKSKFANIEFCEFDLSEPYMSLYYILCIFSFFRVYKAGYKRSLTWVLFGISNADWAPNQWLKICLRLRLNTPAEHLYIITDIKPLEIR